MFRVFKQAFEPSLFTEFLTLRRVTPERYGNFSIHSDLTEKQSRKVLRMSVFADADYLVTGHTRMQTVMRQCGVSN